MRRGFMKANLDTAEANRHANEFSIMDHIFTMTEIEIAVIVIVILIFLAPILYKIYKGQYKPPAFLRPYFKSSGSRYD